MQHERAIVIKFGGSTAVDASGANLGYFRTVFRNIETLLTMNFARAAFVIGGGQRVRDAQAALRTDDEKDKKGIEMLREHAQQLGKIAGTYGISVHSSIPHNTADAARIFEQDTSFAVSLGGLQIGQSTDTVAVHAAELFMKQGYEAIVCILSNVARIYTADPKKFAWAKPIRRANVRQLIVDGVLLDDPQKFRPGMHATIDPVAVEKLVCAQYGFIPVWFGHGLDIQSLCERLSLLTPGDGTSLVQDNNVTEYYPSESLNNLL